MSTAIKTQFESALSPRVTGGAGSMAGRELNGIAGTPSLTAINGSPIVTFDTGVQPVPPAASLDLSDQATASGIRKSGI